MYGHVLSLNDKICYTFIEVMCPMISKYQMIYQELSSQIRDKKIMPHTYLPSENELMILYDASRDTIRKSLNLLVQNGYIVKEKGKGSKILNVDMIDFSVSGITSFKEIRKTIQGDVETNVHVFVEEEVDNNFKEHLYMDKGHIYHIERIRKINQERVILDIDYLNAQIIPGLTVQHAKDSLYAYIEKELGLKIGFAKKEITVIKATKEEKELLDLLDYDLLVCVQSYTYLEDATLFQYTISKHRPGKFRFIDYAKRISI